MEHPCHKCNQPVEDGVPFCSHCGASQIRVAIAESPPAAAYSSEDAGISPVSPTLLPPQDIRRLSVPVVWSKALRPCALAAGTAILLMALRLYSPVALLGAGLLSVVFYRRHNPGIAVKAAVGARLGALSGLLSFGMSAILGTVVVVFLHQGPEIRNQLFEKIDQAASQTSDPRTVALLEQLKTPSDLAVIVLSSFFLAIVLASIGGALGGAFCSRGDRSEPGPSV
jgi:hypothetical protein